jgi:hypothetical protein
MAEEVSIAERALKLLHDERLEREESARVYHVDDAGDIRTVTLSDRWGGRCTCGEGGVCEHQLAAYVFEDHGRERARSLATAKAVTGAFYEGQSAQVAAA